MPFELPKREPCPFCENVAAGITSGGVECVKVIDDELAFAFVAPRPIQPGSLLVIPKRHALTMLDISDDELTAVMRMVRRLSVALTAVLDPVGLNVFQNNGVVGYQTVAHFHVHIVPRYPDDGGTFRPPQELLSIAERADLASRLRTHLDVV